MRPTNVTLSLTHLTHQPPQPAQSYPTIIALHGRGSHEGDLIGLAPLMDDGWLWISPRAPLELDDGYEWYRLEAVGVPNQATFDAAVAALNRFVAEALSAYPVDPARVVLLGFSQGGMMAHTLTLAQPARVAGVIAHSSYIPLPAIRTSFRIEEAGVRDKPFLLLHGVHDPVIPVEWGRAARDTLTSIGAAVEYFEFAGGHQMTNGSLTKMREWLKQFSPSKQAS
ncbi:MAG: alpha/beta hydrolase [Anaerolineales bacterium]